MDSKQLKFFSDNGYLKFGRVLSDEDVEKLKTRCEEIAEGRNNSLPSEFIQLEQAFRENDNPDSPRLDTIRKMTHLTSYDKEFEAVAKNSKIVDVIEQLLVPNIKLYGDQLMMKPRFNGTVTDWHQDSVSWPFFIPQQAVSAWVALDNATVENGCMTVIPGSHKWGPISREYKDDFLEIDEIPEPVSVEIPAGHCMFHHGLMMHRTGANTTENRRRGLALHYITSETIFMGAEEDWFKIQKEKFYQDSSNSNDNYRFMHIRGEEFPGRV